MASHVIWKVNEQVEEKVDPESSHPGHIIGFWLIKELIGESSFSSFGVKVMDLSLRKLCVYYFG